MSRHFKPAEFSKVAGRIAPGKAPMELKAEDIAMDALDALHRVGIFVPPGVLTAMVRDLRDACDGEWRNLPADMSAMDAVPDLAPLVMTAGLGAPIQFLQAWLPGFIHIITAARNLDRLIGSTTVGSWEDEEIILGTLEPTGLPQAYGDYNAVPLASWNVNFERRSIVRFEQGMEVGDLEQLRTARMKVDSAAEKRNSAGLSLDILRNRIGFYGFNNGAGRTYGFLNDPNAPAYVNVAAGTGGLPWSTKTFKEIQADIREVAAALQAATTGVFNPQRDAWVMALPTSVSQYFTVTTDQGVSVQEWLDKTFKGKLRIEDAPELQGANGGANVLIAWVETIMDGASTDGGKVWEQLVPVRFRTIGSERRIKTYVEDYGNALAGTLLKRPFAVVRRSGI